MTPSLAQIWRHPIKGIGAEALQSAELSPKGALNGDRAWALLTSAAENLDDWQPRRNFLVVANGPDLARVSAKMHKEGEIHLSCDGLPDLIFDPETEAGKLRDWVQGLWPTAAPPPARLVRAPGHGMTDIPEPHVSIGNLASLRAMSDHIGIALDPRRFRINLWLDGLAPWEELDFLDQTFSVGGATLRGRTPIERCRAPDANPQTGKRDASITQSLYDRFEHKDFGIYASVETVGIVHLNDGLTLS